MEKFYVAIAVDGLDIDQVNSKRGINFGGNKSSKCRTAEEAEKWAQERVAQGHRCKYVIFEALSIVQPKEQPFIKEELKQPLLTDMRQAYDQAAE